MTKYSLPALMIQYIYRTLTFLLFRFLLLSYLTTSYQKPQSLILQLYYYLYYLISINHNSFIVLSLDLDQTVRIVSQIHLAWYQMIVMYQLDYFFLIALTIGHHQFRICLFVVVHFMILYVNYLNYWYVCCYFVTFENHLQYFEKYYTHLNYFVVILH